MGFPIIVHETSIEVQFSLLFFFKRMQLKYFCHFAMDIFKFEWPISRPISTGGAGDGGVCVWSTKVGEQKGATREWLLCDPSCRPVSSAERLRI